MIDSVRNNLASKTWSLFAVSDKRKVIILILLMLIGTALETLGIGLVLPILSIITDSNIENKYPIFKTINTVLDHPGQQKLVIYAMIFLVLIYLIKTLFLLGLTWLQMSFAFTMQAQMASKLFKIYLLQPYTFHLQRNSANLINNVITEVNTITGYALLPGMTFIIELMVLVGLSVLLLFVETLGASVVILLLVPASLLLHALTHKRIEKWGGDRQTHDGLRVLHLQQSLHGVKEIKIFGSEMHFLEKFNYHNFKNARVGMLQTTFQHLPRLWIEMVAIAGLAILVITMFSTGKDAALVLPSLGLFAVAAFRLIPSVIRLLASIQSLKFGLPMINSLCDELNLSNSCQNLSELKPLKFESKIELKDIDFIYENVSAYALKKISFSIRRGESIGIVGPSGSGKSTIVDLILGLLAPTDGQVLVDGVNIQENLRGWQSQIGYVPQTIYVTDDTLQNNIAFGLGESEINKVALASAIKDAQLEDFISNLPDGLSTVLGDRGVKISGGQRQRIGIARALYNDPKILILDEATSALDIFTEANVMEPIKALHKTKTVIIVAHRLSTVEHCDRIFNLELGKYEDIG